MDREHKAYIESLIMDLIGKSIEEKNECVELDDEFKKQVDKWISQFDDDEWMTKFTAFIGEQLFEHGYNVIAAIDEDDYWNNSIKISKRGTEWERKITENLFLRNTFLDIFAVDRKADPIIFDDRMDDEDFSKEKISEILECHINLVVGQLEGWSLGEIYDNNQEKFDKIVQRKKSYEQHV